MLKKHHKQLDLLLDYICLIMELKLSCKYNAWSQNKWSMPTFEYYIEHVVNNPGGPYDFTRKDYKSHIVSTIVPRIKDSTIDIEEEVIFTHVKHSQWKHIPFNFEYVFEIKKLQGLPASLK